MPYGVIVKVAAPAEAYDALHADVLRSTEAAVDGLLLHIGRASDDGFEVIEVWTDKAQFERYSEEVVWPAAARLAEGQAGPPPSVQTVEFDVRGLVIPAAHLAQ